MSNFHFLTDPVLADLCIRAEVLYSQRDPNTALMKLRQFAEQFAFGLWDQFVGGRRPKPFGDVVARLESEDVINEHAARRLNQLWKTGSAATHHLEDDERLALEQLEAAWSLAVAFERGRQGSSFRAQPFRAPRPTELWIPAPCQGYPHYVDELCRYCDGYDRAGYVVYERGLRPEEIEVVRAHFEFEREELDKEAGVDVSDA